MKYNIINNSLCSVNMSEGNKTLSFYELENLFNDNNTSVVTLSGSDVLVLDFDFGHRIHLDRFEYRFYSYGYDQYSVASGINFYYKDEGFEDYTLLDTNVSDENTYYTSLDQQVFAPRYIKFRHDISNTYGNPNLVGDILAFRAINNDSIVDFGVDGTQIEEYMDIARVSLPTIREVKIYNSGELRATAYVNVEPAETNMDKVIQISTSEDGPWYGVDSGDILIDSSNFDYGISSDVQYTDGILTLTRYGDVDGDYFYLKSTGSYTTKIFTIDDIYTRIILDKVLDDVSHNISVDKGDPSETIEIRSSSSKPKPYSIIRELRQITVSSNTYGIGYRDRWLENGNIKEDSLSYFDTCFLSSWREYRVSFDRLTERWFGFCVCWGTSSNSYDGELILFNHIGTNFKTYVLAEHSEPGEGLTYKWIENKCDYTGGVWIYFYCLSYRSSDFVHSTGYYLAYFSSTLSPVFSWYSDYRDVHSLDVDYNSRCVWYTRDHSNAICRVYVDGTMHVNFSSLEDTNDLGGIVVLRDGGVLFANGNDIHRLELDGTFLPEYTLRDVVNSKITHMELDVDDENSIWVIFGLSVGRLYVFGENAGSFDFSIILDRPSGLTVDGGGVWVRCADPDSGNVVMNYVSKIDRKVIRTLIPTMNSSYPGVLYQDFTHKDYVKKLPIATDNTWSALTWSKVSTSSFLSLDDRYYQVKLKFRRQDPIEKYPTFISDASLEFINSDSFNQESTTPNQLLWGNWTDKPNLNRVFVDTVTGKLKLIHFPDSNYSSFIQTSKRLLIGRNGSGLFDVRIKYKIGNGNGVASGKEENLYMYFYNPSVVATYPYFYVRLNINSTGTTNRVYAGGGGGSSTINTNIDSVGTSLNAYEGELRAYWDGSTLYGQMRPLGGSFSGTQTSLSENQVGKYFYCHIINIRTGSNAELDDFEVLQGHSYYYSDSNKVNYISTQKLLEVKDIYPNNFKSIYLKAHVPVGLDVQDYGNVDLKVRWRIPV